MNESNFVQFLWHSSAGYSFLFSARSPILGFCSHGTEEQGIYIARAT